MSIFYYPSFFLNLLFRFFKFSVKLFPFNLFFSVFLLIRCHYKRPSYLRVVVDIKIAPKSMEPFFVFSIMELDNFIPKIFIDF